MKNPRLISYDVTDFDYYPKGTTGFFVPRTFIIKAYKNFKSDYEDLKNANDDTSLIRHIAKNSRVYMSPKYKFTYISRSTLKAFIRHTLHRGIVFIDGHFRRDSRYYIPTVLYLLAVPIALVMAIIYPVILILIIPGLVFIFLVAKILGVQATDAAALAYVMPIFTVFYTIGLYKGLFLKLSNQLS
jgi:hypothetical protein